MTAPFIEVELRGPLTDEVWRRLVSLCDNRGKCLSRENRFLVDYSTFLEGIGTRRLDVRVRVTNRIVEIVVKQGRFGGASRAEAAVRVADGDLGGALGVMALLGYKRGVACDRGIVRYELEGIEFAIQDVRRYRRPDEIHSRFYEAEIRADEASRSEAEEKIRNLLARLELPIFSEEAWNEYVAKMNDEANGVYDFDVDDIKEVQELIR